MKNLVTPSEYARLKGVTRQYVNELIQKGKIEPTIKKVEKKFIDLKKYPV